MKKKIISLCLVIALALTAVGGATLAYFTDKDEVQNTFTVGKVDITLDEAKVDDDGKALTGEKAERVDKNEYKPSMVPGHVFDKDPTIHVEAGSENSYIFLDVTLNSYKSLFWVMAADASADSEDLENFSIFDENNALKTEFKNSEGVFSTTKFLTYMATPANKDVFQAMIGKWITGIKHSDWELCDIIPSEDGQYLTLRLAYQGDKVTTANSDNENNYMNTVCTKDATKRTDIPFMKTFGMPASVTQDTISDGTTVGGMQNQFQGPLHLNFTAYAIQADGLPTLAEAYQAMFSMAKGSTLVP